MMVADALQRTRLFSPPVGGVSVERSTIWLNGCCVPMGCEAHMHDSLS